MCTSSAAETHVCVLESDLWAAGGALSSGRWNPGLLPLSVKSLDEKRVSAEQSRTLQVWAEGSGQVRWSRTLVHFIGCSHCPGPPSAPGTRPRPPTAHTSIPARLLTCSHRYRGGGGSAHCSLKMCWRKTSPIKQQAAFQCSSNIQITTLRQPVTLKLKYRNISCKTTQSIKSKSSHCDTGSCITGSLLQTHVQHEEATFY